MSSEVNENTNKKSNQQHPLSLWDQPGWDALWEIWL